MLEAYGFFAKLNIGRSVVHGHADLIRPVIAKVQIVIALEVTDFHLFILQPKNLVNYPLVSFHEVMMVGDPEIKNIAEQEQMCNIGIPRQRLQKCGEQTSTRAFRRRYVDV